MRLFFRVQLLLHRAVVDVALSADNAAMGVADQSVIYKLGGPIRPSCGHCKRAFDCRRNCREIGSRLKPAKRQNKCPIIRLLGD